MTICKLCPCPADWVFHYKIQNGPEEERYYCVLHKLELAEELTTAINLMSNAMDCTISSYWSLIN